MSSFHWERAFHTATYLPSVEKVLITGGCYDGWNYLTTPAANLNIGRYEHTATLIPDSNSGTVLICGGTTGSTTVLNTCELHIV